MQTDREIEQLISKIGDAKLDTSQAAVVREAKRKCEAACLPAGW